MAFSVLKFAGDTFIVLFLTLAAWELRLNLKALAEKAIGAIRFGVIDNSLEYGMLVVVIFAILAFLLLPMLFHFLVTAGKAAVAISPNSSAP